MSNSKQQKYPHFPRNLAGLRRIKGITQSQLADSIDASPQAVTNWESGRNLPNKRRLRALAEYFDCDIDHLLTGPQEPFPVAKNIFYRLNRAKADGEYARISSLIHDDPSEQERFCKILRDYRRELEAIRK